MLAAMRLCGMNQERMTQVHRAGVARGRHDRTMRTRREAVSSELTQRQPLVSCRRKLPSNVGVRPDPNERRRISLASIREQKQHQQGSPPGVDIGAP
jgi:hypothetical protein